MTRRPRHDMLVMSDSDIRVTPDLLRTIAAEFQDPRLGSPPARIAPFPGRSLWSHAGSHRHEHGIPVGGVLVARMLEGMKFALGPTVVGAQAGLADIGGWRPAEGLSCGRFRAWATLPPRRVGRDPSSYVVEHRIGIAAVVGQCAHRLRWFRSTRRSRPGGIRRPALHEPAAPGDAALDGASRMVAHTGCHCHREGICRGRHRFVDPSRSLDRAPLVPGACTGHISFLFWISGFFGNTILWRGRRYRLMKDGTFQLIEA